MAAPSWPPRNYCRLGIETEIAVRLGEDLPQGGDRDAGWPMRSKAGMAAIELLEDLRHDYKRLSAAAMVAGNVWNAGIGARRAGHRLAPARPGAG